MELDRLLAEAQEAVQKAGIPEDLRQIAFSKAIEILSKVHNSNGANGQRGADEGQAGGAAGSPSQGLSAIALFYDISSDLIEDYFTEHDGDLHLEIDSSRLGSNTADRARALATLLITARQIGGCDSGPTRLRLSVASASGTVSMTRPTSQPT